MVIYHWDKQDQRMPERERDATTGRYATKATADEVLDVFERVLGPVVTTSDVASALDVSTETARQRLGELVMDGYLDTRKTGRTQVYWIKDRDPDPSDAFAADVEEEPRDEVVDDQRAQNDRDDAPEVPNEISDDVWSVVDEVSDSWDDDQRKKNRRMAGAAALHYALNDGSVGKSSEIVDAIREQYPVDRQDRETYYRKNIRAVLSEVGDYSRATGSYSVESLNGGE